MAQQFNGTKVTLLTAGRDAASRSSHFCFITVHEPYMAEFAPVIGRIRA